jgi:hypothetical protein
MMRRLSAFILLSLLTLGSARAADVNSAEAQASLRQAEMLGRVIYGKAAAAEIGNALLEKEGVWHPGMAAAERPFQRRISLLEGETWLVRYLSRQGGSVVSRYDVRIDKLMRETARLIRHQPPEPVDTTATAMFEARGLAPKFVTDPCAGSYTVVVLPSRVSALAGWTVYALTGEAADEIAVGGDYRAEVSANGRVLKSAERLSKGCLTLKKSQPGAPGAKLGGIAVDELISDTPTEIQVYLSIRHKLDVYVHTRLGKWLVSVGRIRFLEP